MLDAARADLPGSEIEDGMQDLTVVFDLDGTLVETAPDLIRATNHVLELKGLAPVPGQTIRPSISFGGRVMIETALGVRGAKLAEVEVDAMLEAFLEHYAANIAVESHAFPGLERALDGLAEAGARLAVCTNKREHLSRQLLAALGLAGRFSAIAGRDTFAVYKPHPDHLTGAIRMAGGDTGMAVMIGDSDTDIKTARAAGLPVIGVPFGYTDTPMEQLGPDALIAHYDDLIDAIGRVRPAPRA
jgi:phosphoglycolate phosphatase